MLMNAAAASYCLKTGSEVTFFCCGRVRTRVASSHPFFHCSDCLTWYRGLISKLVRTTLSSFSLSLSLSLSLFSWTDSRNNIVSLLPKQETSMNIILLVQQIYIRSSGLDWYGRVERIGTSFGKPLGYNGRNNNNNNNNSSPNHSILVQ